MTLKIEAIVGTTTYNISDLVNYRHMGNDGFGLPSQRILSESGPLQHGVSFLGYRLDPRIINLILFGIGNDEDSYFARRLELIHIFRPSNTPILLRITKNNGAIRQIDTYYNGGLSMNSSDKYVFNQKVAIQLVAPNPIFYNPILQSANFGLAGGANAFNIPWVIPWNIGTSTLNQSTTIVYAGDFESYPIITIYGPITNAVITNNATGDKLDFTGTTISAGEVYTIDTRYGHKTVVDASNVNKIAALTTDSDLTTFRLIPNPEVVDGNNSITVTGTSVTSATQIYISFYENYLGL